MQDSATWCNIVQHGATWCNMVQEVARWCNMVQHGATLCNVVQNSATWCNMVQHEMKCRYNIEVIAPSWPLLKNKIILERWWWRRWSNDHRAYHEITKVGKHTHTKHSYQRCGFSLSFSHGKVKVGPEWHLSVTVSVAETCAYSYIHMHTYHKDCV